jgi:hypothetical protein
MPGFQKQFFPGAKHPSPHRTLIPGIEPHAGAKYRSWQHTGPGTPHSPWLATVLLGLGMEVSWVYEWRFTGHKNGGFLGI